MKPKRDRLSPPKPAGAGRPLPSPAAEWIGAKLQADVNDVRVHTDDAAARLAAQHDAAAVTRGNDIHFAPGAFQPDRVVGIIRLLHETTHAVQQRGSAPPTPSRAAEQESEVDRLLDTGDVGALTTSASGILREPTYPRRTTGNNLIAEAERVLTLAGDPSSTDAQRRMWSRVSSNFSGGVTCGSIARRIWTYLFLRHFTEPEVRGRESAHPRYFYSRTYGWVDAQHFFGFIDFAEQERRRAESDQEAFAAATERGFGIERDQQRVRDYVMLQRRPPDHPALRLMQVRPPNTPAFRTPVMVAQAGATALATTLAATRSGAEGELVRQLSGQQLVKLVNDSAMSAWTFEDPTSNQLGIRFFFQHGRRINAMPQSAREGAFRDALATFFSSIGVVEDQTELDEAARGLPGRERYEAPHTTETRERARHPDLYRLP